jgi:hypothetical protein
MTKRQLILEDMVGNLEVICKRTLREDDRTTLKRVIAFLKYEEKRGKREKK